MSAIPPLNRSYNECSDELCKKQMCEVIARNRLSHLVPSESNPIVPALFSADAYGDDLPLRDKIDAVVTQVYGGSGADFLPAAAKELDLTTPKTPDSVLSLPPDTKVRSRSQLHL